MLNTKKLVKCTIKEKMEKNSKITRATRPRTHQGTVEAVEEWLVKVDGQIEHFVLVTREEQFKALVIGLGGEG